MVYNMTNLTYLQNASSMTDIFLWSNQASGDMLGNLLLFGIFIILFMTLFKDDPVKTLYITSWICLFIAALFYAIGIGSFFGILLLTLGVVVGAVYDNLSSK